jgi:type II secretory ATPase GspE/PulE/Tfp pilus assembly ATPase PilB-like protein
MDFIKRQYGADYLPELELASPLLLHKPKGCEICGNTGYKGRTGVHELLSMTPALRSLVYKTAPVSQLKAQAMNDGMRTLIQDGILKVIKGDTDIAQIQMLAGG